MNPRWIIVGTLIALAFAYSFINVEQRVTEADRQALTAQATALCRGTAAARVETNRRNAALHTYLVFVLRIHAHAERLHPDVPVLRPLIRRETAAARRLVQELRPLGPPPCLAALRRG